MTPLDCKVMATYEKIASYKEAKNRWNKGIYEHMRRYFGSTIIFPTMKSLDK